MGIIIATVLLTAIIVMISVLIGYGLGVARYKSED